jgi:hypothetical protein
MALRATSSGAPGTTGALSNVNLTQVGGLPIILGSTTQANGMPMSFPTDQVMGVTGSVTASGTLTLGAGSANIGNVGIITGSTVGLVTGSNIIGRMGIDQTTMGTTNGMVMLPSPNAGGCNGSFTQIPANSTPILVKGTPGTLYGIAAYSSSSVPAYVHVYNNAAPVLGTTARSDSHLIPAPAAGGGGGIIWSLPLGLFFSTAISFIVTLGMAGTAGDAPPTAATYTVTFYYK